MKRVKVIFSIFLALSLLMSVFVITPSAATIMKINAGDLAVDPGPGNYTVYSSNLVVLGSGITLEYKFEAPIDGNYYVSINAGADADTTVRLTVNNEIPDQQTFATGSFSTAKEIYFGTFHINKGENTIKVNASGSYLGLKEIIIEGAGEKIQTNFARTEGAYRNYYLPVLIEAEDFDIGAGGAGSPQSELVSSKYRENTAVPVVENSTGYQINLRKEEWTKYTFNVLEEGAYKLALITQSSGMLNLFFDDQENPIAARTNGAGRTEICTVRLKKGVHTLRVEAPELQVSLDGIEFASTAEKGLTPEELVKPTENVKEEAVSAKIYKEFFVSADASSNGDGTAEKPFKTIEEAKAAVAKVNDQMDGDIVVRILPGEYELDEKLIFTTEDEGKNGYNIIYHGSNSLNPPIISGGTHISGWTKMSNGLYKTTVPNQDDVRQLYINGYAAQRARSKYIYNFTGSYDDPETDYHIDGYSINKINFPEISNPEDAELVYNILWTNQRVPVKDVIETDTEFLYVFDQPYFGYIMTKYYDDTNPLLGNRCYIENAYELIDEPGEFYFNKKTKEIFYYPFPEEDMSTADTVIGRTEFMLEANGNSSTDRIENLTFSNLDFRYGTWLDVNRTGVSVFQADCLTDEKMNCTVQSEGRTLPAQLQFNNAKNITIKNCNFQNLGSSAVSMIDYVNDSKIEGNVFRDFSGAAVVVGSWRYSAETHTPADLCKNIDITNNVIRRNGLEFYGCPSIGIYYAHDVNISNNDISCTPYTSITLGWGWGSVLPKLLDSSNHLVANNRLDDISNSVRDGGHVYMLGEMMNTVVEGNYCTDSEDLGGIYYDNGTAMVTSRNNVVENVKRSSVFGTWQEELKYGNQVYNNYTDLQKDEFQITANDIKKFESQGCRFEAPIVIQNGEWPEEARKIMANAGLEPGYRRLLNGVDYPAWRIIFIKTVPGEMYKSVNVIEQPAYIYMDGGEGVAYHKNQAGAEPKPYKQGTGYVIGGTSDGEWINYEIEAKVEGLYNFELSYALAFTEEDADNTGSASKVSVYLDGEKIVDKFALTPTGSWAAHLPAVIGNPVHLSKGKHVVRVEFVDNGWSFEKFRFMNTVVTETEAEFDDGMRK